MKRSFSVRRYKDGTIGVRVGRQVEFFSTDKTKAELFSAVKYALISKGVSADDLTITEMLRRTIR